MAKLTPEDLARLGNITESDVQARIPDEPFDWQKALRDIKGMLVGDDYAADESFLRAMMKTIYETHRVSPGQRTAIERIKDRPYRGGHRDRRNAGW